MSWLIVGFTCFIMSRKEKLKVFSLAFKWNGSECSHDEKYKASQETARMKGVRGKCHVETLDEDSVPEDHPALMLLKDGASKTVI